MPAQLRIMRGVPMSPDYEHTRLTASKADQLTFFNSFPVVYQTSDFNQIKMQGRGYIDVKSPYSNMAQANYMYFINTNIDPKTYFCFVTDIEIKSNDTTRIYFVRDVFQTWLFDFTIMPSLIDREHVSSGGTRNIIPENIMTGNEYEVIATDTLTPQDNLWFVIVCKQRMDMVFIGGISPNDPQTNWISNHPEQLYYYYFPFSYDGSPSNPIPGWVGNYVDQLPFTQLQLQQLLFSFTDGANNYNVATNNIVNMYISEFLPIDLSDQQTAQANLQAIPIEPQGGAVVPVILINSNYGTNITTTKTSAVYANNMITGIDNEKLNYAPFTKIEIYDNRGNAASFVPEGLPSNNQINLQFIGSIGANQSIFAGLSGYNLETGNAMLRTRALFNNTPQDIPIVTDYLDAFLQGNKNALENQKQFLEDDYRFNKMLGFIRTGSSLATAAATTGPVGVGMEVVNSSMSMYNASRQYQQNVANITAKQEDLEAKPPSVNAASGNLNMTRGNDMLNYTISIKRVRPQYINLASNHFKYYGFSVARFGVPNMTNRQSWNYVKLGAANIKGNFYQNDLENIKGIFEKGITLWHTNDMMNYNLANGEV